MSLEQLAATSERVAATTKRNEKIAEIARCLGPLAGDEIAIAVAFLSGETRQSRLGVSYAAVKALGEVPPAPTASLGIVETDSALERIAATRGSGSVKSKREQLVALLRRAVAREQVFLRRLLVGEIRQGALAGLMIEAVARATAVPVKAVRRAHMLEPDLGQVACAARLDGARGLEQFRARPFKPVLPMLAGTAEDVDDALERLGEAALEYKLDGARVQIHKLDDEVRVFSRQLNEVTEAVPELVDAARRLERRACILDGETLALRDDGRPHPFQVTMRRFGRRRDVDRLARTLPLTTFCFDCLLLDDQTLIDEPTDRRWQALESLGGMQPVPRLITQRQDEARTFLESALGAGHEGLMAKAIGASYSAGGRGAEWLKVKPAHSADLVVLAAEWGSGRRQGWLSNLHLGARNAADGSYVMMGKTFKGLTDVLLRWQTEALLRREVERRGNVVYVRPELVVEIAFNDVQVSPHYPAGLALRFARVKRYRPDKRPEEADTVEAMRALQAAS